MLDEAMRQMLRRDADMLRSTNRDGETSISRVEAFERLFKHLPELIEDLEAAEAKRDALKAAIAEVRRLCDLTIAASCRVQAIDQARDTLAVLDRSLGRTLDAPETPGDANG